MLQTLSFVSDVLICSFWSFIEVQLLVLCKGSHMLHDIVMPRRKAVYLHCVWMLEGSNLIGEFARSHASDLCEN